MISPVYGTCCLCGSSGKLSFEHFPPRKAFNENPVLYSEIQDWLAGGNPDTFSGRKQRRGVGAYTLCESCNNRTGGWYGRDYISLTRQGMQYLQKVRSAAGFYLPFQIKPLHAIKQIICMFASASGPELRRTKPELARFVLNREERHLPDDVRVFAFYSIGDRSRSSGLAGLLTGFGTSVSKQHFFSETTFPPFGFVLSLGSPPPDERLTDITYFADDFRHDETRTLWLRLPVLPVYTIYPGDYRSRDKVLTDASRKPE
jgi:hypothetical protein